MDANVQTYPIAPPSIALALMAWHAAWHRVHGEVQRPSIEPVSREDVLWGFSSKASPEYYRIIDRITWSSHPDWNTPNWCSTCTPAGLGYCRCEVACNE